MITVIYLHYLLLGNGNKVQKVIIKSIVNNMAVLLFHI